MLDTCWSWERWGLVWDSSSSSSSFFLFFFVFGLVTIREGVSGNARPSGAKVPNVFLM